jgi:hypothetical protein
MVAVANAKARRLHSTQLLMVQPNQSFSLTRIKFVF